MNKKNSGFTLIELLVVISIIAMLSSVVLVSTRAAAKKGRDTARIHDVKQMVTALEMYASDHHGSYPQYYLQPTCDYVTSNTYWADFQTAMSPYIAQLPRDPSELPGNGYCFVNRGNDVYISFITENAMPNVGNTTSAWGGSYYYHMRYMY